MLDPHLSHGWDDTSTTPNAADGSLQLTAEYQASVLQRTVWGTATACHGRVDVANSATVHAFLDGAIAVYLEGPLPTDASQVDFIMGWSGTIGLENGAQTSGSFDFRIVSPQIEVRIAVPDGHIIGSVGTNEVSLRGTNGTYGCSLQTFSCGLIQTARGIGMEP